MAPRPLLPGIVSAVTGAITQAVAALFFVQSNRSKDSLSASFDRLRQDTRAQQAPVLAKEIADIAVRDRVTAAIALGFAQAEMTRLHGEGAADTKPVPPVSGAATPTARSRITEPTDPTDPVHS